MTSLRDHWRQKFPDADPKIICVGLNYRDHAAEQNVALPDEPLLFGKFSSALVAPNKAISLPQESSHVDAEAELAIVIGHRCRNIAPSEALDVILGYTIANDVSARDLQFRDSQWLRAKSFDSFCPLLPDLTSTSELGDASGLAISQRVNGQSLQESNTSELIFGPEALISHISAVFTLDRGDIILTGTPAGVGIFRDPPLALTPGDVVEVEVERVGILRNPVVAGSGSRTASRWLQRPRSSPGATSRSEPGEPPSTRWPAPPIHG
jgi:2-keto-4-pentenoate hydratase/2-oxohepta-3-ene-1,7-dioic acid hydratase in catechol pathway